MFKLISTLLMVFGALLKALGWSGGTYFMLTSIDHKISEQGIPDKTINAWGAALGLALFGLGVLGLSFSFRRTVLKNRVLFAVASALLVVVVLLIGFGNWNLDRAFSR